MSEGALTSRERILQAAAGLFRRKGYTGASMREVAEAVGMTKSSLYHHFRGKQALLLQICDETVDRTMPALQEIADSGAPAFDRLRQAAATHVIEAIRDQDNVACFIEEGRFVVPEHLNAVIAKRDRYEGVFRRIIQDGIASGEFRPVDVRLAGLAILGMCNSVARWYQPAGPLDAEKVAGAFGELAAWSLARSTSDTRPPAELIGSMARNLSPGEPVETGTEMRVAHHAVFHDPAQPSKVVLPIGSE